jgi:transcriptional regulator with XRE-family HTH domain
MRWELLKAIKEKNLTQRDFARLVNEHESVISRIVTGTWNPDNRQKLHYSKVLGRKVNELFPAEEAANGCQGR